MSTNALEALQSAAAANQASGSVMINPAKIAFYRMMLGQLRDDGLIDEAKSLANRLNLQKELEGEDAEGTLGTDVVMKPAMTSAKATKDELYGIFENHMSFAHTPLESEGIRKNWQKVKCRPHPPVAPQEDLLDLRIVDEGDDFEMDGYDDTGADGMDVVDYLAEVQSKPTPHLKLRFSTQHKQGCRSVAFSHDGRLCASGSIDTSIKVMETSKMRMHSSMANEAASLRPVGQTQVDDLRPVIRTFYDHVASVTSVAFHPRVPILYSGSADKTVKIYDLTRPTQNKKAQSSVTDVSAINVVSCHPCGDFLFVGTQHRAVRLYDTTTMQCYSSYHHASQHSGAINDIKSSADGSMFASVSSDGAVFLWDGINHRVVNRIPHAHTGQPVFTCQWSRNQRYLLTSGGDNRARLWDTRTGKMLLVYSGPSSAQQCEYMTACFAAHERMILLASTDTHENGDLSLIDSKTGSLLLKKANLHEKCVRGLAANPTDKTFLTASDDTRIRFFDIDTSGQGEATVEVEAGIAGSGGFVQHVGL